MMPSGTSSTGALPAVTRPQPRVGAGVLGRLTLLAVLGLCPGRLGAEDAPGISHYPGSYYMGEHPARLHSLADLPDGVRLFVESHLGARLGAKFYAQLKFAGGRRRDPADPDGAKNPGAVYYELEFSFRRPQDGIAEYVALLALRADGTLQREIDLPQFGGSAARQRLVSLAQAKELAAPAGFSGPGVAISLAYNPEQDCLCWQFRRGPDRASGVPDYRALHPAHIGELHYRVLEIQMADQARVELRDEYAIE